MISNNSMSSQILVIDDEPHIRMPLVRALELRGYMTQHVDSGIKALEALKRTRFDLIVLDMQMPGIHGIEVMRQARQMIPDLSIIVLTGHATVESAIAAVKSEAIDYLTKPTSLQDIVATIIRALQKRQESRQRRQLVQAALNALHQMEFLEPEKEQMEPADLALPQVSKILRVGDVSFNPELRCATVACVPPRSAELTKGEAVILEAMMRQPNQTLSCRELASIAWDYDLEEIEAQSLVRPYVFRLRQKLEGNADEPKLILTVRGSGYTFSVQHTVVAEYIDSSKLFTP
jgi:DNA-binding response OmpR family regulator